MCCLWLNTALPVIIALLCYTNAALAFDAIFKLPCSISYNGKPPITTDCTASIRMSQEVVVATIKTPNGKTFNIENNISDIDEWYLNHERAEKVSEEPNTCYQNQQVKICF